MMVQIRNLHASVGSKLTPKAAMTLLGAVVVPFVGLSACAATPAEAADCGMLARDRERDVSALVDEYRPPDRTKSKDSGGYPSVKQIPNYLEFQARLEGIESRYQAQCGGKK